MLVWIDPWGLCTLQVITWIGGKNPAIEILNMLKGNRIGGLGSLFDISQGDVVSTKGETAYWSEPVKDSVVPMVKGKSNVSEVLIDVPTAELPIYTPTQSGDQLLPSRGATDFIGQAPSPNSAPSKRPMKPEEAGKGYPSHRGGKNEAYGKPTVPIKGGGKSTSELG